MPSTNPATTLPGCSVLRAPLITPASISGTTPSGHISLWMPRSRRSPSPASTALGMPADADLEGGAIGDQLGDVLARRAAAPASGGSASSSRSGRDTGHDGGGPRLTWRKVSPSARGIRSFISTMTCDALPGRGQGAIGADAQAEKAVLRRAARSGPSATSMGSSSLEEPLDLPEQNGRVVGPALRHRLAHVVAQEQPVVPEVASQLRCGVVERCPGSACGRSRRPAARGARGQRLQQRRRGAAPLLHPDAVSRANQLHGHLGRGHPLPPRVAASWPRPVRGHPVRGARGVAHRRPDTPSAHRLLRSIRHDFRIPT